MSAEGFGLSLARMADRQIDQERDALQRQIDGLLTENKRYRMALETITVHDKTVYQHHERRPSDGRLPEDDGGTVWKTPAEIAMDALHFARRFRQGEV